MGRIICGNSLDILKALDDASVDCCVTSPPYYALRDYGKEEQIGLEETPEEYIEKLVSVFREVRRVLKDDGTLWVNIGDSYNGSGKARSGDGTVTFTETSIVQTGNVGSFNGNIKATKIEGLKPKDMIGIPWMLAFALREDGWYLRQDIIWAKPNPMPESITDRCTKSHEYIFLLSKSRQYYFDYKAIQENANPNYKARYNSEFFSGKVSQTPRPSGGQNTVGMKKYNGKRNKRDVWTVTVRSCKEAHFATFPETLIEPCILAGSRPGGGWYSTRSSEVARRELWQKSSTGTLSELS